MGEGEYKYKSVREALPRILINLSGRPAVAAVRYIFISIILIQGFPYFTEMVQAIAGETTIADINITADGNFNSRTVSGGCWIMIGVIAILSVVALSAILYGKKERREKQRTIAQVEGHIRALESTLDPNRSSSGLTPKGETNPEDK